MNTQKLSLSVLLVLFIFQIEFFHCSAQKKYSTFYYQRATLFEKLPIDSTDIVFLGNSITNGGEWAELFHDARIKNRGISGDICEGVYDRLDAITQGKPNKIFLLIGVNDISRGTSTDSISSAVKKIIKKIKYDTPRTKVFLQSVLPINPDFGMFESHIKRVSEIKCLNEKLIRLAKEENVSYIDLYSHFVLPKSDKMNPQYTNDGLHLLGEGYLKWVEIIRKQIEN